MIRALDLLIAGVAVAILSPVLLVAALAVLAFSGRPVLYRARRAGKGGRPIDVLKFRSMTTGSEGASVTVGGDDRITPVGELLRATKVDELPQLLNVLRGEMSLVGPRPEDPRYVELFESEFEAVLSVPPGITGVASLKYRSESEILAEVDDPEAHYVEVLLPDKLRLEADYVADRSVWCNVKILLATIRILGSK